MNLDEIKKALSEALTERGIYQYSSQSKDQVIRDLQKQVEEMQKIIDTAVMYLQSNDLHVKAQQIKAMAKSLKEETA